MRFFVALALSVMLLVGCGTGSPTGAGISPSPTVPSATSSPSATPFTEPPFSCLVQTGGMSVAGNLVSVTGVVLVYTDQFDRLALMFGGDRIPGYEVIQQPSSTFTLDPSAQPVTLQGSYGLKLVLRGAQYSDAYVNRRVGNVYTVMEARKLRESEGVVTFGLGLSKPNCFRAFTLSRPARLVVDVAH